MRIIDTLSRMQPGKVPAREIIMADYHSERVPKVKTPKVKNSIADKIKNEKNKLEGDLDKIENLIPGHHKNDEEKDSSSFDIDMSTIESLGN